MILHVSAMREPITDDQLHGFKYFLKFLPLLDRLHDQATARDKAATCGSVCCRDGRLTL